MDSQLATVKTSKIVVVNDDSIQLKLLAGLLEKNGYAAAGFGDAATALERMSAEGPPDLIVTDLYMPGIDGWRFCRLLRSPEYGAFNQTPILVVSATFSGGEAAKITTELGANAFLPSPVRGAEFIKQVQRLLASEAPKFSPSVLIVEDTPSLSAMLVDFFQSRGYQADAALNGRAAREKFTSTPYDLTLLDYHLPDALGDALLLELQVQRPETLFVMITGDMQPRLALEWMKLGASAYVRKPFDLEYLFACCENARRERALLRIPQLLEQRTREMQEQEARFLTYLNNSADAVLVLDREGRRKFIFGAYESITGYPVAERINKIGLDLHHTEDAPRIEKAFRDLMTRPGATVREEWRQRHKSGHWIWVEGIATSPVEAEGIDGIVVNIRDITERKLRENEREQIAHLILLVNTLGDFRECMSKLTASLQGWSGCEAVGIRLRAGDDYPYYESRGFPSAFVQAENHLCACGQDGEILRDDVGHPVLECMCGNVLRGRFDPAKPFFTAHGSFWSNSTTALLASTTESDRQARTRNRCNGEGYESVALIPLRTGEQVFGLLQFTDHHSDRFTPELISCFERMADNLALALSRRQAEEELRQGREDLARAQEVGQIGSWRMDVHHNILTWSDENHRIFGVPKGTPLTYETFLGLVHPDDRQFVNDQWEAALAGAPYDIEHRIVTDGRMKWVHELAYLEFNAAGTLLGGFGVTQDITKRKQAEAALGKSESRLREVLDNSLSASYKRNMQTNAYEYFSPVFARISGYSPDEMKSMSIDTVKNLMSPDDLAEVERVLDESLSGAVGTAHQVQYQFKHKDGHYLWFHDQFIVVRDPEGQHLVLIGSVSDITERKRAEEALRESDTLFRTLAALAPVGIYLTNPAGDCLYANPAWCKMAGLSLEEALGRGWVKGLHPDDRQMVFENWKGMVAARGQWGNEYRFQNKEGKPTWVYGVAAAQEDSEGNVIHYVGVNVDITERKRAEEALRRLNRELKAMSECDQALLRAMDEQTLLDDVCRIICDAAGYRMAWVGFVEHDEHKTVRPVAWGGVVDGYLDNINITWSDTERGRGPTGTCIRSRQICYIEDFVMNPMASPWREAALKRGYRSSVALPLRGEEGRVFGALTIYSEEVNAFTPEELHLLMKFSDDLAFGILSLRARAERRRAEEEKAKLQDLLLQSQKMESVGRLAGGVAHDFNNMLGVILGHVEMAITELGPAHPLHDDLAEVLKAAQRSADLTRQLLAFARKQTIAPRVLVLNATVTGMLKMLERLIGEDIALNWRPEAELWPVKVDPSQIDQILANLCVNARDAISGIGQLSIETGNSTFDADYCAAHAGFVPGEYVRLAVSDTGCGMDRETLARIFEPFFTTKGVGLGTGLGLATVYGVVKQNGGFINVYSEPGQGTTFTIYLPRHGGKAGQEQTDGAGKPALRGHETILLVEDEPAILKLASMMLNKQGYTVCAASTPGEAIRLAREHAGEIHLLMTDVIMPEMNGRDLAKNLLSLYPHLKRLFMSGYTADVIAHHGVLDEGIYFIQKPFAMKDLSAKVREALDSE